MGERGRPRHPDILTPREWEVLDLLRASLTNDQIAERLSITERTAKYHVSEILGKLGLESRHQAAEWSPDGRPWWLAGLVPLSLLRRSAAALPVQGFSLAATAGSASLVTALIAGLALIAFLLARSAGGDLPAIPGHGSADAQDAALEHSDAGEDIGPGDSDVTGAASAASRRGPRARGVTPTPSMPRQTSLLSCADCESSEGPSSTPPRNTPPPFETPPEVCGYMGCEPLPTPTPCATCVTPTPTPTRASTSPPVCYVCGPPELPPPIECSSEDLQTQLWLNDGGSVFRQDEVIWATFSIKNCGKQEVRRQYGSGQTFDAFLFDGDGKQVWRWSDGKAFMQVFWWLAWGPGETVSYAEPLAEPWTVPLRILSLAPGSYHLRAVDAYCLHPQAVCDLSAELTFEIVP